MIQVRPFLNTDPPALAVIINNCCGIEAPVSSALLEHAVFSKICFSRDRLLVATDQDSIVGFVHLGSAQSDDPATSTLTISNLLFFEEDLKTAEALVSAASGFAEHLGLSRLRIGTSPENAEYYNGISTHFLNVGIPDAHHVLPILESLGFKVVTAWNCYQCDPLTVQIPFRREHMLYRRSHEVMQVIEPTFGSETSNLVFSHLANSELRLINRDTHQITARLLYASLSRSYPNWPAGGIDILNFDQQGNADESDLFEYLVCELLRQSLESAITPLRAHLSEEDTTRCAVLTNLGFHEFIRSVHVELKLPGEP